VIRGNPASLARPEQAGSGVALVERVRIGHRAGGPAAIGRDNDAVRLCERDLSQVDLIDRKILDLLQQDATLSIAEIGERVGLSQTPCWKRIQKLEAGGVIERRVALLNPERVGLGLTVFVSIEIGDHSSAWLARFAELVSAMPEVLEFYRMAGDVDYMLRVVVRDMQAYDAFYKRLIGSVALKNVTSRFAMERVKSTTALPLDSVPLAEGADLRATDRA
jgi:Lrp/AsnC family transcriptional regulator